MHSDPLRAEHFEALLRRLDPDRDLAGLRYEQLRKRLLVVFTCRGCADADELADQTMDRVARRLREQGPDSRDGDLAPFVFGVAWNIARESYRRPHPEPLADDDPPAPVRPTDAAEDKERAQRCLDRCLAQLAEPERALVLSYFDGERQARINRRAMLAREHAMTANALRLRIWRLTATLRVCTRDCLDLRAGAPSGGGRP
jgi:DNA-directed RNA polymerase specialized sigma24 family protein